MARRGRNTLMFVLFLADSRRSRWCRRSDFEGVLLVSCVGFLSEKACQNCGPTPSPPGIRVGTIGVGPSSLGLFPGTHSLPSSGSRYLADLSYSRAPVRLPPRCPLYRTGDSGVGSSGLTALLPWRLVGRELCFGRVLPVLEVPEGVEARWDCPLALSGHGWVALGQIVFSP